MIGEEEARPRADGVEALEAEWKLGVSAESLEAEALELTLSDGQRVSADAIILATGTRARRLPFGRDLDGVVELRTLEDARRLRASWRKRIGSSSWGPASSAWKSRPAVARKVSR